MIAATTNVANAGEILKPDDFFTGSKLIEALELTFNGAEVN